ncbi:MAG TPA: ATP-binding protein, partial [Pseudomonas sp.]|uniref:P-loop ATPase, Sll1717 family n=1 Tax=Pseudomonas sp. TaxID=306 RepID=UPI002D16B6D7
MKGNILGDIRAENDEEMLNNAFLETQDYKTLLSSNDRCIIVGRRGTGKSALVYKLNSELKTRQNNYVIKITPEEDQIMGLRDIASLFGDTFNLIRAGAKIAWRYTLYMEVLRALSNHYKNSKHVNSKALEHLRHWLKENTPASNLRKKLKNSINPNDPPGTRVADLTENLELEAIEAALKEALSETKTNFVFLIDKLDEGYTPDTLGVALIDGFAQAVIDINSKFKKISAFIFLRDNIFRSIAQSDPDFTRNIEGQVLRIHWDEYNLFNLICNRLRAAFNNQQENNTRIWNTYTARDLKDKDGFRLALRLTLYRPRDILVLLNNAFLEARSKERTEIIIEDIDCSAKSISQNRLTDLQKEYGNIFQTLSIFIKTFTNRQPELSIKQVTDTISEVLSRQDLPEEQQREILLIESPLEVIQKLYSIGFVGIYENHANSFIFCHDGKDPSKEFSKDSKLLIHPCYWLALNLNQTTLTPEFADDIYDEYDIEIEIDSINQEERKNKIGRIMEEIKSISPGREHAHNFEDWCLQAIRLVFAGSLSNIQLHDNKSGVQQRDIIATNTSHKGVWKNIYDDYRTRQVIFEVKNFSGLAIKEYRQVNSYLCNEYG